MRFVYLLGIDGCGKTTLAEHLVAGFKRRGYKSRRLYARHFPFLLVPLKLLARQSVMRGTNEFSEYRAYVERKRRAVHRLGLAREVYKCAWICDYVIVTRLRMMHLLATRGIVVVDRYYLDVAVNIAVSLSLPDDEFLKLARSLGRCFPRADRHIYLDVPEEIAFRRKRDIPSMEYLRERRQRYLLLAKEYDFTLIDGTRPLEEVAATAFATLERDLPFLVPHA